MNSTSIAIHPLQTGVISTRQSRPEQSPLPGQRSPVRGQPMGLSILALSALLCLALGCTVGPDFKRPEPEMPSQWMGPEEPVEGPSEAGMERKELVEWWGVFQDPVLASLIDRAVQSNLDIRLAETRIRQARAYRFMESAGWWPMVDVGASASRGRTPLGGSTGGVDAGGITRSLYRAGLDAAWELDIFGGTRRAVEAADADIQSAIEEKRAVWVSLAAEVALIYLDLRAFQQLILIAGDNLRAQEHSVMLTKRRFEGGFVSGLDVRNAEAQAATTAAQIPALESMARQSIYSLGLLLGQQPSALIEELSPMGTIPSGPPRVPAGLPSELLRQRPDIRQAEAQIHAATARIGVATADLFPRINILGSGGFQGGNREDLTSWSGRFWSLGATLSWPLFDAGRIRAHIEAREAMQEQSLLEYQKTVLTALKEVEDALIASTKEQERRESLKAAVAANRKAVDLANQLYTEGHTDFLNVLNAQRSLLATQEALAQSDRNISQDLVSLYKALGGGWDNQPDP